MLNDTFAQVRSSMRVRVCPNSMASMTLTYCIQILLAYPPTPSIFCKWISTAFLPSAWPNSQQDSSGSRSHPGTPGQTQRPIHFERCFPGESCLERLQQRKHVYTQVITNCQQLQNLLTRFNKTLMYYRHCLHTPTEIKVNKLIDSNDLSSLYTIGK